MTRKRRATSGGVPVTDKLISDLAAEAERGYEPEKLRGRGRPPLGAGPSEIVPVRFDSQLRRALEVRAADEETTQSDVIRRALRAFLGVEKDRQRDNGRDTAQSPAKHPRRAEAPEVPAAPGKVSLVPSKWDGSRPLVIQPSVEMPLVIGVWPGGEDVLCPTCEKVALLRNVVETQVFDLTFRCAGCGAECDAPNFPPGRGLAFQGPLRAFDTGVLSAQESLILEYDDVVIGKRGVLRRQMETGRLGEPSTTRQSELNEVTLEALVVDAREVFAPILPELERAYARGGTRHRLPELVAAVETNLAEVQQGGRTIDVLSALELERDTYIFRRWSRDPAFESLLRDSRDPGAFDHNVLVLILASRLDNAGFGPELVRTSGMKSPDLRFRLTARVVFEADIKAPVTLQRRPGAAVPVKEAQQVVADAITSSRGQFSTAALLVIAGSFWTGDFSEIAEAAAKELAKPLSLGAKPAAREHREKMLCGVILMSAHIEQHWLEAPEAVNGGQPGWMQNNSFRWIANPIYSGGVTIDFSQDLSKFHFTIPPEIAGYGPPGNR
jgi:hypothetical protein